MKRMFSWQWLSILVACITIALLFYSGQTGKLQAIARPAADRYTLSGYLRRGLQGHQILRRTAENQPMRISLGLRLRNADKLDVLIAAQNHPGSPQYHRYLAPHEFAALFGADQQMVDQVVTYLQSQNLAIDTISPAHLFVDASGTASSVEHAFHITLADYTLKGRVVYAPLNDPSLPLNLANTITSIVGLDNMQRYHPHYVSGKGQTAQTPTSGYTPDQLRTAYNIAPLTSRGNNGAGQIIALLELDGYQPSDIDRYYLHYSLGTPKHSDVLVDGAVNEIGSDAVEVELDMEVAAISAPSATQMVYMTPNTPVGVIDGYDRIVSDNLAKVVSSSWGLCEDQVGKVDIGVLDSVFKQAAAQGQAIFAASGDNGAYACGDMNLGVDSPADNPYVVGVGGTSLHLARDGAYLNETAWFCLLCLMYGPNGAGGGGGVSTYFPHPAYQAGAGQFYSHRTVPDVSANADPTTGYSIYCTVMLAGCAHTGWRIIGGTSAATPLWAGIAADINQYLAGLGKPGIGHANETLYRLFNTPQPFPAYHDVVSGNNLFYLAGPGYDLATGIGTPDAWNLARDLARI